MNQHEMNNRENNHQEMTVQEFLQQMGIAPAVENFLGNNKINDLLNEVHGAGCLELAELIKTMPAAIQETLNQRLEGFEGQVDDYIDAVFEIFREALASHLSATTEVLSPTAATKVAQIYQEELDSSSESLFQMMCELADETFEVGKDAFKKSWILHMNDLDDDDDRHTLLKAALGDDVPEGVENCRIVPVYAKDPADAMRQLMKHIRSECGLDDLDDEEEEDE